MCVECDVYGGMCVLCMYGICIVWCGVFVRGYGVWNVVWLCVYVVFVGGLGVCGV